MKAATWGVRREDGVLFTYGNTDAFSDEDRKRAQAIAADSGWTAVPLVAVDDLDNPKVRDQARQWVIWARRVPCTECHAREQEKCLGVNGPSIVPHPARIADSVLAGIKQTTKETT